jgi:hypothetical protein
VIFIIPSLPLFILFPLPLLVLLSLLGPILLSLLRFLPLLLLSILLAFVGLPDEDVGRGFALVLSLPIISIVPLSVVSLSILVLILVFLTGLPVISFEAIIFVSPTILLLSLGGGTRPLVSLFQFLFRLLLDFFGLRRVLWRLNLGLLWFHLVILFLLRQFLLSLGFGLLLYGF